MCVCVLRRITYSCKNNRKKKAIEFILRRHTLRRKKKEESISSFLSIFSYL
jgi:hypothetical protein